MRRRLRTLWTRPSLLGVLLLPTVVAIGAGNSGSALATPTVADVPSRTTNPAPAAFAVATPAIDPLLGVQPYLHEIPFGATIASVGERYDVDPLLIAAVVEAESSFRADAVSPRGALGLMQVMPVHLGDEVEPFDPEVNLELGAALLAELSARYDGRLDLALAAYHAGPGAVARHRGVPPYAATQRYVARVLEIYLEHYAELVGERSG
jgi:soluble lytic murein transglycosylase-like protein